jgi:hypothetical protein
LSNFWASPSSRQSSTKALFFTDAALPPNLHIFRSANGQVWFVKNSKHA